MARARTLQPGTVNTKGQKVLGPTGEPGSDHLQRVYVLECTACGHEYGVNGSDVWQRKCPRCGGGAEGEPFTRVDLISAADSGGARNPPWTRDELILALDLYVRFALAGRRYTHSSPEIAELSAALSGLGAALGEAHRTSYRNANGVYMKLMNYRRFDPAFKAEGKSGLTRGNKLEQEVWEDFAAVPARLTSVASGIRLALANAAVGEVLGAPGDNDMAEGIEGRVLSKLHFRRERDRKLVQKRKDRALKTLGRLACEGCGFNFSDTYGERGRGFIECHHVKAIETLAKDGQRVTEKDLALVCANCHRMIHARRPWLTLEKLQALVQSGQ